LFIHSPTADSTGGSPTPCAHCTPPGCHFNSFHDPVPTCSNTQVYSFNPKASAADGEFVCGSEIRSRPELIQGRPNFEEAVFRRISKHAERANHLQMTLGSNSPRHEIVASTCPMIAR
jgi:hypothetical protein